MREKPVIFCILKTHASLALIKAQVLQQTAELIAWRCVSAIAESFAVQQRQKATSR